jgi:hypothetical protein
VSFLLIFLVPWFGFTKMQMAGITTGLFITGEVLFYTSLFILGKSFWDKIKSKTKFWKTQTPDSNPSEQNNPE